MNVSDLKQYWKNAGETLYTYSPSKVDNTKVGEETFSFLTTCGLPSEAAPTLSFGEIQEDILLTPNQILKIDFEGLDDYLMIGSNGSGDPLCIDTLERGEIVYLNHDNYFERIFINSSIQQFAICLTKYRDFFLALVDFTTTNFARKKFTDIEFEELKHEFTNIDSRSLLENSFWTDELNNLLWERDNE